MTIETAKPELLIVRAQNGVTALLRSRLAASVVLLYLPFILAGIYLEARFTVGIFSRGVLLSTLWLALAPFLIQDAHRVICSFFEENKSLFEGEKERQQLKQWTLDRFQSPAYLLFGVPWAVGTTAVILMMRFSSSPLPVQIWAGVTYFLLFLISAIGFQGVVAVVGAILRLAREGVRFDPYHPDQFGGMEAVGRFAVRGTLYFSTGSLVLPLVFELMETSSFQANLLNVVAGVLTALFVCMVLYSFLLPVLRIKAVVSDEKDAALLNSNAELEKLYGEAESVSDGAKVQVYYEVFHKRLLEIKDYPYDLNVLIELFAAVGLPILIASLEKVLV